MPSRNPGVDRRQDAWRRLPLLQSPLGCDTHWGKSVRLNSGDVRLALCCIRPAQGTCRQSIEPPKLWMGAPPPESHRRQAVTDCPPFLHTHLLPSLLLLLESQEPGNQALSLGRGRSSLQIPLGGVVSGDCILSLLVGTTRFPLTLQTSVLGWG